MNERNSKLPQDGREEESLLDLLRRCPIDEKTWTYILDRPNDPPREIDFDDFDFDDNDSIIHDASRRVNSHVVYGVVVVRDRFSARFNGLTDRWLKPRARRT